MLEFRGPLLPYYTLRDDSLDHQVKLITPSDSMKIMISCNCRAIVGETGGIHYEPMGETGSIQRSRELYNNPKNHEKPFDPKVDGAKW